VVALDRSESTEWQRESGERHVTFVAYTENQSVIFRSEMKRIGSRVFTDRHKTTVVKKIADSNLAFVLDLRTAANHALLIEQNVDEPLLVVHPHGSKTLAVGPDSERKGMCVQSFSAGKGLSSRCDCGETLRIAADQGRTFHKIKHA
jgi:hypothetical protein